MKSIVRLYFTLPFLLLFGGLHSQGIELRNLKCDYQQPLIGIENKNPGLSWEIYCPDQRNIRQVAYQLLVASSPERLNEKDADIWNSGIVESDNSTQVLYDGKDLKSSTRYFWNVRIKAGKGEWTPYSNAAFFETGLLEQECWKAKWISAPSVWNWPGFVKKRQNGTEKGPWPWDNNAPMFRKEFHCSKQIKSARMYVSGVGYYEASLNGERVGDHRLDPAFTRYDKTVLYVCYDITSQLGKDNAVGIILGNGWYNMFSKAVWGFDHAPWRGKPRALMQIEVVYADSTKETIVTDDSWKVAPSPVTFNNIRQGMVHDARLEQKGWDKPGYDDVNWTNVFVVPSPGGELKSQMIEPVRPFSELKPVNITKSTNNHYLVDFGQNLAGWAKLSASGKRGDTIVLRYGELLKDGMLDQSNVAKHMQVDMVQTDRFVLKGKGIESFETKFTYHGFQYIEVSGFSGQLKKEDITAVAASTDMKERGAFECSNPTLNQIQKNTLWSFRTNYYGYPTDCPHREKNGWTGDAQLAVETGLWNFHAHAAYTKYFEDMADEQRSDGNLAAIIPSSQWGYFWGNGPAWIGAYIIMPWQMYIYDGDLRVLEKHYTGMKKMLSWFTSNAENNILSIGLGDWAPFETKTPVPLTSTAYYYHFACILAKVAKLLDKQGDYQYFNLLSAQIKKAFNQSFYNSETGVYANGSQTAQSCAIYFQLVDANQQKKVVERLVESVEKTKYHIDAGILGAKYLPHALVQSGHSDLAYKLISNETFPGWGWWIKQGATTLWEDWDGTATKAHSSKNHIMFGDVSNWFYQYLAGIRPDTDHPGFKHFYVEPLVTDQLTWAKATFESVYGTICVAWKREDGKFKMELEVPCNTEATVTLPGRHFQESGQPLNPELIKVVSRGRNPTSIKVGSGVYHFESLVK